jgi:hypothetical protein
MPLVQSATQTILALAFLVFGILGVSALVSERARKLVIDRMLGSLVARASRQQLKERTDAEKATARSQRVNDAVRALSHGLMLKGANLGDQGFDTQATMDERRHAQLEALAAVTTLKAEYPDLHGNLNAIIAILNDPSKKVDPLVVSSTYLQPILDVTKDTR